MPLNAANVELMTNLAAMGAPPIHEGSAEEARALEAGLLALIAPGPDVARVEDVVLGEGDATFAVRIYVPREPPAGVIVYFHGGGWVLGTLDGYDPLVRALAVGTGYAVVSVAYRLAPEHPYPAAVDDATLAFEWASANLDRIVGTDNADVPLVVAGDSAGGNLTAVVARRNRDRSGPPIAMQVLVYPVTDSDTETSSYLKPDNQLFLDRPTMLWFWDHYVPDRSRRDEPDVSPLQVDDLSGLPPALVITAEYDPLREEGEAYAERLRDAGVPTTLIQHDGQMHGFFSVLIIPGHEVAVEQIAAALDGIGASA